MGLKDHTPDDFEIPDGPCDRAEFWRPFYDRSVTPWDLGRPHPELAARLAALGSPRRAYVPGCGRGHDAHLLAEAGYEVTAIDYLDVATQSGSAAGSLRFRSGDALEIADERYGLWWDHTFFCALPPARREDWGRAVCRALRGGGLLAALVFPVGKKPEAGGPPYGMKVEDLVAALGDAATLVLDEDCRSPAREKGERFALFLIR